MQENAALSNMKAQLHSHLLQKHEVEFIIKEKTEYLSLLDEKIAEVRHAINGAQLALSAVAISVEPPEQILAPSVEAETSAKASKAK